MKKVLNLLLVLLIIGISASNVFAAGEGRIIPGGYWNSEKWVEDENFYLYSLEVMPGEVYVINSDDSILGVRWFNVSEGKGYKELNKLSGECTVIVPAEVNRAEFVFKREFQIPKIFKLGNDDFEEIAKDSSNVMMGGYYNRKFEWVIDGGFYGCSIKKVKGEEVYRLSSNDICESVIWIKGDGTADYIDLESSREVYVKVPDKVEEAVFNFRREIREPNIVKSDEKYIGVNNDGRHDCPVISTVQMLNGIPEFRDLVLHHPKTNPENYPFFTSLQEQFNMLNIEGKVNRLVFSEDQIKELKIDGVGAYDVVDMNVKWAGVLLLDKCVEECMRNGDQYTAVEIRKMFDFNLDYDNIAEKSRFVVPLFGGGFGEDFKKEFEERISGCKNLPTYINICKPLEARPGFQKDASFEIVDKDGNKRRFEVCQVLMHSEAHYYVYVKDFKTGKWIGVNDKIIDELPDEKNFGDSKGLQYVFREVK